MATKPIKGYEGLYEIDTAGNVYSLSREINRRDSIRGGHYLSASVIKKEYIKITPTLYQNGYYFVTLYDLEHNKKAFSIHRLVAETFIPNPLNLPCVNHLNENKEDNRVENLEWCTYKQNSFHSREKTIEAMRAVSCKPVLAYRKNGEFVGKFPSLTDASNATGVGIRYISKNTLGDTKQTHGYIFKLQ